MPPGAAYATGCSRSSVTASTWRWSSRARTTCSAAWTAEEWSDDLAAIVDDLADRATSVVVVGTPPFGEFPSLPGALARYCAERSAVIDRASARVCAERPRVTWMNSTDIMQITPDFFARDGFHPSAHGYRLWAQAVADHLNSDENSGSTAAVITVTERKSAA